ESKVSRLWRQRQETLESAPYFHISDAKALEGRNSALPDAFFLACTCSAGASVVDLVFFRVSKVFPVKTGEPANFSEF
ncbi:MAG: hypothetical protein ACOYYU_06385, partial [Chloroflexota bacterium]